jgi:heterogeneous nuclear ribonucleoprotein F/H
LEIAPNGITIALDDEGKNTGDAYVEFASADIASQAMNKHKEKIGHRLGGKLGHAWVKFLLGVCGGLYI